MIKSALLLKNRQTSIIFGFVGTGFGLYKSIDSYDNYVNKNKVNSIEAKKIFDIKIITNTLIYGSTFALLGYYPVISTPFIVSGYIYDKYNH